MSQITKALEAMVSPHNFLKYFGSKLVRLLLDQSTLDTLKESSRLHKQSVITCIPKEGKSNFFI